MIMLLCAIISLGMFSFAPEYASHPPAAASAIPPRDRRLSPYSAIEPPVINAPKRFASERASLTPALRRPMLNSSAIDFPLQVGFISSDATPTDGVCAMQSHGAIFSETLACSAAELSMWKTFVSAADCSLPTELATLTSFQGVLMLPRIAVAVLFLASVTVSYAQSQPEGKPEVPSKSIKVTLLGTAAGPPVRLNRYQMSTLVEAGGETLLFDCGRGTTLRLTEAGVPLAGVSKLFITHLHSDHIVDIPDLYLSGWVSRNQRKQSIEVWGPAGTRSMMDYLQKAFAFDIHIRRDVDEHFSDEGIQVISHDVQEGIVYEHDGVKVTAFLVDHGPVKPAY